MLEKQFFQHIFDSGEAVRSWIGMNFVPREEFSGVFHLSILWNWRRSCTLGWFLGGTVVIWDDRAASASHALSGNQFAIFMNGIRGPWEGWTSEGMKRNTVDKLNTKQLCLRFFCTGTSWVSQHKLVWGRKGGRHGSDAVVRCQVWIYSGQDQCRAWLGSTQHGKLVMEMQTGAPRFDWARPELLVEKPQ